ncbi:hypothetical protein [Cylindrospermum sp. FACHB-282]|uniref:hypothetical protein n=1 Tax=Cylindrospermum sp. FACHB-282 TaxID=2692794 RepID=UPI00168A2F79|nr:hypothetical protein [Cylindrospermum sp. FACHB-282]MBD2385985.1 hypothetical protein [Cylindrospermum sp. FACHB-282]
MEPAEYVISIKEESLDSIPKIIEQLNSLGATNVKTLSSLGIIIAFLTKDTVDVVSKIEGVAGVEPSRDIRISTPNENTDFI